MGKINTSHILVAHEYEAQDILKRLNAGASFEELARKHSQCASATNGGLLGKIDSKRLDEDFSEAAFALKINEISKKPVRTKFGYHIIRRNPETP